MKHSYYLIIFVLALVILFLSNCTSRKAMLKQEDKTEINIARNELANDASVIDYHVDTTRECEQSLEYDVVEYYPAIDSSTHQQYVKSVKKVRAGKKAVKAGKTDSVSVSCHKDSIMISKDSIASSKIDQYSEKKADSRNIRWWWLIIAAIIVGYIIYKKNS